MGAHASIRGQISVENIPAFILRYLDSPPDQKEVVSGTKALRNIHTNQS